jgi:UDP-N-acetylmuramate--alanine ligase
MQSSINMFSYRKKIHLIGIGGIGVSGIAQLLLAYGCKVSGSDLKTSALIEKLKRLGVQIFIGHDTNNLIDVDTVIYSAAIKDDNPELKAAYAQGITVLSRSEALAILANQKRAIAITGAHGKTTTASLIAHMLVNCNLNPTICVGGELVGLNGNAFLGKGQYFVLEADESDGSFLDLRPFYSVITNVDKEHLDYYRDLEHIIETFGRFIINTQEQGCVFFCQDDYRLKKLVQSVTQRSFSFGLSAQAQIWAEDIKTKNNLSQFNCIYKGCNLGELILKVPGRHNICNALACIAVGLEIGLEFDYIRMALDSFRGVRRRLELKLRKKDLLIFEDYAHHPTEIRATLVALKEFQPKRILTIFQPHRYSRTKFLIDDFGRCFQDTDYLIVTDIYSANEVQLEGVDAESICQKAREAGIKSVYFLPKECILKHLLQEIQPGDVVAIMGAGDIGSIADELVEEVKSADLF